MTKDEAKKIKDAAWLYGNSMYDLGAGNLDIAKAEMAWRAFDTPIDSMIEAAERLPTVYPRKGDWVEFGTQVADKTPAELAAENALCNAAYRAKKDD